MKINQVAVQQTVEVLETEVGDIIKWDDMTFLVVSVFESTIQLQKIMFNGYGVKIDREPIKYSKVSIIKSVKTGHIEYVENILSLIGVMPPIEQ